MKELLEYMLRGILGDQEFSVDESTDSDKVTYSIKTNQENVGLIIGKGGRMIKALRNLLKVRATLEKKVVFLNISE
jgi:predicted RNA-binding protein YlqC (UPF0109 family)